MKKKLKKKDENLDFYKLFKPELTPKRMMELGVFGGAYFGLNVKERSKGERWAIMIVMSIVTWTLPTIGIPYMNYHIEQYLENHREITPKQYNSYRLGITIALSLIFLKLEWMAISFIEKLKL